MRTQRRTIAVVEDDPAARAVVVAHLKKAGFDTTEFTCAGKFEEYLEAHRPDLVVLDRGLPDGDGLDVCKAMRADLRTRDIPVVVLSGRDAELDRVLGLELGADDYVTKPFSGAELVARVKLRLRPLAVEPQEREIALGPDTVIDLTRHEVRVGGKPVQLTVTEFRLLRILAERPGWVFSRDALLAALWGDDKAVVDRTVDLHVSNIRKKLAKAGAVVKSVRGVGYKIELPG